MKKILIFFGTRPEAIKLIPVINELRKSFKLITCNSGQHKTMLNEILEQFSIYPDRNIHVMTENQGLFDITQKVLSGAEEIIKEITPDLVLVQGDTTTALAAAMAALYLKVPVGHIEAGLRTYDLSAPFPEEFNRQCIARIAKIHFAPTEKAKENLLSENIPDSNIFVTGNTVIDILLNSLDRAQAETLPDYLLESAPFLSNHKENEEKIILVTVHRREIFGDEFMNICNALREIAKSLSQTRILFPVHRNPRIRHPAEECLSGVRNIILVDPLPYLQFVRVMNCADLILTDSGGIQEEAPSLGKPVLVMRRTTERTEGVEAGTVRLIGTSTQSIVNSVTRLLGSRSDYQYMSQATNPYGDGRASIRVREILEQLV